MAEDLELFKKRLLELSEKAERGLYYTFTDFLGLSEQAAFAEIRTRIRAKYEAFGGCPGTERIILRFGDPEEIGYDMPYPITVLRCEPLSEKFADRLTHRDFLGSVLGLGIERDKLGDIPIIDNVGYIFCKEEIADYIKESLTKVKHTDVRVSIADTLPEGELFKTKAVTVQIASERLDALIAKVWSLSRDDAQQLIKRKLVYVGGRLIESTSYQPKENDVISIRGKGRMIYLGFGSLSKKGKLNAKVEVYV